MQIYQISFGKKIPKYKCQIKNKRTGELEPATFYEVDCKDKADFKRIKNLDSNWAFSYYIYEDMHTKYTQETYKKKKEKNKNSFYIIENKDGKLLGISEVEKDNDIHEIKFIESIPYNKYKYVGQNMMAAIGKELLDKNGTALTLLALEEAVPFYEKLGFEHLTIFRMKLPKEDVTRMIEKVENKTQSPLIDINI